MSNEKRETIEDILEELRSGEFARLADRIEAAVEYTIAVETAKAAGEGFAAGEQSAKEARLIAAAPDLYEALRECVGEMCKFCKETEIGKCLPCESGCEIMRRAKTALEKAGGEE